MTDEIAPAWNLGKVRFLFFVAGLHDIVLGGLLLCMAPAVFAYVKLPMPAVPYIHFLAALFVIFGLFFWHIMLRPDAGRMLIPYAILQKLVFGGGICWYWWKGVLPWTLLPPAGVALLFLLLFLAAFFACPGEDDL